MKRVGKQGVSPAELRRIALSFPGASEGTSYGKPSFLIAGKFFTRLRSEDDSLVLIVGSIDERDMLLESDPALFHITDHYKNYPSVLARRTVVDAATLHGMLERRWRALAPKKLVKEFDENQNLRPDQNVRPQEALRNTKKGLTRRRGDAEKTSGSPRPPRK